MKNETRYQARQLREQGKSIGDIASELKVARSSVSEWVRDIQLTEEQQAVLKNRQRLWGAQNSGASVNRDRAKSKRLAHQDLGRQKAREQSKLHMAGCLLYWAEGAKSRNCVNFVNSDASMVQLFFRFLQEELGVKDHEIVLYIHSHSQNLTEIERIKLYWLELLDLPSTCIRKILYKKGSETRKTLLANGVCSLRVYRTDLIQHIYGAIQEYGGFDRPEWLF